MMPPHHSQFLCVAAAFPDFIHIMTDKLWRSITAKTQISTRVKLDNKHLFSPVEQYYRGVFLKNLSIFVHALLK